MIVGIRPEDFEDAALAAERERGINVRALIDVLESTGSDVYAHLSLNGGDGSGSLGDVIARLDSSSGIGEGKESELWLDTSRLHLFDPDTGERLASDAPA